MSRDTDAHRMAPSPKMMHGMRRPIWVAATTILIMAILAACSKAPQPVSESAPANAIAPLPAASASVLRVETMIGGIATEYAASFETERLYRIVEHRRFESATPGGEYEGEYEFEGARLLRYRGARLRDAAPLDLQFDMQGMLQSGRDPNVSDDEIDELRNRAQLLRSHALARRATKLHQ
jgi:hypothetical protein